MLGASAVAAQPCGPAGQCDVGRSLRSLVRWWGLDPPERAAALAGLWRLTAVTWQLKMHGFSDVHARLDSVTGHRGGGAPAPTERLARIVDRLGQGVPWRTTCLHRSLTLAWMLRERGIPAEMRIGVGKDNAAEALLFHAWVEIDGLVVNDSPDVADRFAPFRGFVPPDATFS